MEFSIEENQTEESARLILRIIDNAQKLSVEKTSSGKSRENSNRDVKYGYSYSTTAGQESMHCDDFDYSL